MKRIVRVNPDFKFLKQGSKLRDIEECFIPHRIERWIEKNWNHRERVEVLCNKKWMTVPREGLVVVNRKVLTVKEFKARYLLKYDNIIVFDHQKQHPLIGACSSLIGGAHMVIIRSQAMVIKTGDWLCSPKEMGTFSFSSIPKHLTGNVVGTSYHE